MASKSEKDARDDDSGMRGDGVDEKIEAPGISIPIDLSPVQLIKADTKDGKTAEASYRMPPGNGPFPAIVFIHGGMLSRAADIREEDLLSMPIHTHFLSAGYVVVASTFRTFRENPSDPGRVYDNEAIIEHVKRLPQVDPDSVVVFGGSGGGDCALQLAGRIDLAAIVAGEPATILLARMLPPPDQKNRAEVMKKVHEHYTKENERLVKETIAKIRCPVLILHGDQHPLKHINFEIIVPELKAAGKDFVLKIYPGLRHGFYWGNKVGPDVVNDVFNTSAEFLAKHIRTKPTPIKLD